MKANIGIIVGTTVGSVIIVVVLLILYWKFDMICICLKKSENNVPKIQSKSRNNDVQSYYINEDDLEVIEKKNILYY